MNGGLSYEETVRVLRGALVESEGNSRGFAVRARGRPELVSSHTWQELAEIEDLLAQHLEAALRSELRVVPHTAFTRIRAHWRGLWGGLASERALIRRLFHESTHSQVEAWRAGAPQLEAVLWPFFVSHTQYLANTLALALDEPAPSPPLIWHPGRREFRLRGGE